MSEKQQRTAKHTQEHMLHRYDDDRCHKHNKSHILYRGHSRTYPVLVIKDEVEKREINQSTGRIRARNLQKIRKRFDKRSFH